MRLLVWLVLFFFSILFTKGVFADQIFPGRTDGTFGRHSREPNYNIQFHSQNSPFHPDDDQESVVMPNKNGDKFLCFLPKVEKSKPGKPVPQYNTSSLIVESEKQIKLKTPDELLEVLKDRCILRQEDWWVYEFCYGKKLRQFHVEHPQVVQEFVLGVYDDEATAAFNQNLSDVSKDVSQRYHSHLYTNGTICDLTNLPRETEVRFVCSEPRTMVNSITEVSTCNYALTVQCPMLCRHPLFQVDKPVWHTINCNPLPKEYKNLKANKDSFRDGRVGMFTNVEYPSTFDSEEHALDSEEYAT